MINVLKKLVLMLLLLTIVIITYFVKIVYDLWKKNKNEIEKYAKGFYEVLKAEIQK